MDADTRGVAMSDARLIRTDLTRVDLRDGMLMTTFAGDIRQTHTISATPMFRATVTERPAGAGPDVQFLSQPG